MNKLVLETQNDANDQKKSTPSRSKIRSTPNTSSSGLKTKQSSKDYVKTSKKKKYEIETYSKKCYEMMYFEERLREKRLREYTRELNEAKRLRRLWKQFQRELKKDEKRSLGAGVGPEWWQEPSKQQITLATCLEGFLKADKEEGVTGRTRQWLLDVGVETRISPKQVRACMKWSFLNPVDFLLEVHDIVAFIQHNAKKKKGHLEKPFSVDERLLLTAVCVLQLPTLLTMLHYILPPPEPISKSKHVQELLYGDLDDESIRYATPYMEPLPFRNKEDFNAWAFDRVYKALLPSVIQSIPKDQVSEPATVRKMSTYPMTPQAIADIVPKLKRKHSEISSIPSVLWLMSQCVPNSYRSSSMITLSRHSSPDKTESSLKSYSRQLTKKIKHSMHSRRRGSVSNEKSHEQTIKENINDNSCSVTTDLEGHENRKDLLEKCVRKQTGFGNSKQIPEELKKDVPGHVVDEISLNRIENPTSNSFNQIRLPHNSFLQKLGLQSVWEDIEAIPKDKQLQHAIAVLADMGDPLAQLPRIHKLPSIQRWLELRKGKKRILTKEDRNTLMSSSRKMWMSTQLTNVVEIPKIKCSKRQERLLTWDKKNWLTSEVTKEMQNYYSRARTEKIDNARSFFPSMLNQYDHGSKLNKNFRDIFFTYFPARGTDLKVFRPWKPHEMMCSRQE